MNIKIYRKNELHFIDALHFAESTCRKSGPPIPPRSSSRWCKLEKPPPHSVFSIPCRDAHNPQLNLTNVYNGFVYFTKLHSGQEPPDLPRFWDKLTFFMSSVVEQKL